MQGSGEGYRVTDSTPDVPSSRSDAVAVANVLMIEETDLNKPPDEELRLRRELARFFKDHLGNAPSDEEKGNLRMLCKHCSANKSKTPKDKIINWMLLRVEERVLRPESRPSPRDLIVCDFLVGELQAMVSSRLRR